MIQGVKIKKIMTHHANDGWFREILRDDDRLLDSFGQVSVSKVTKGSIKAFHWHKNQDDIFYVLQGNLKIVLYDRRKESKTYKKTQVLYGNEKNQIAIFIPRGVAHGYQVIGNKDALVLYCMNKSYNAKNPDEQRIQYNDKQIGFEWSKK